MKEIERKEMRLQLNLRSSFKSKVLMRAGLGLDCWSFEPQNVKKLSSSLVWVSNYFFRKQTELVIKLERCTGFEIHNESLTELSD